MNQYCPECGKEHPTHTGGCPYIKPDYYISVVSPLQQIPTGWQCPVCNKVNAPFVLQCDCHLSAGYTASSTPTVTADEPEGTDANSQA